MTASRTFTGRVSQDPTSKLWVAQKSDAMAAELKGSKFRRGLLQRRRQRRTVYDQYGRPVAQIRMNDGGSSEHEFDDHQDAHARPEPIQLKWAMLRDDKPPGWRKLFH